MSGYGATRASGDDSSSSSSSSSDDGNGNYTRQSQPSGLIGVTSCVGPRAALLFAIAAKLFL